MKRDQIVSKLPCGGKLVLEHVFGTCRDSFGRQCAGWTLLPELKCVASKGKLDVCPWIKALRQFFIGFVPEDEFLAYVKNTRGMNKADLEKFDWFGTIVDNNDPRTGYVVVVPEKFPEGDVFDLEGASPYKGQKLVRKPDNECRYFKSAFHGNGIIAFLKRLVGRRKDLTRA